MSIYTFHLQYFSETTVSPIDSATHEAGSLVLFVGEMNEDTGNNEFILSSPFPEADSSAYSLVKTFTILDKAYTLSLAFNLQYGFSCSFDYPHYLTMDTSVFTFLGGSSDNGGGTSSGGFSVPSLNGNCASLPDGTTVNVNGLKGDFVVEGSQFTWNDSTAQMSMIIYKLSNAGKFCLVPDVYVTAKAS